MKKKTVTEVKIHNFLVCPCKSQDFDQSQQNFARSHDRETVTFRNSALNWEKESFYFTMQWWQFLFCSPAMLRENTMVGVTG